MASMTMAAACTLAGTTLARRPQRRGLIVAKASNGSDGQRVNFEMKNDENECNNGRRDLVVAAATAIAAFSLARVAMADDEPARGTPEAKKKYGPVCVANPTARICRK